jgi:hypothetical protein
MLDWQTKDPHKGENYERASKPGKGSCNNLGNAVVHKCGLIGFKGLRQFNKDDGRKVVGLKRRLSLKTGFDRSVSPWFDGDSLTDRLARALAEREAIDMKEFVESFEFFSHARVKRYGINRGVVVDLACGHGLSGLLFAVFERKVERVILVDRGQPDCFAKIFAAVIEVAPWVKDKVVLRFDVDIMMLAADADYLATVVASRNEGVPFTERNPQVSFLGVHACGHITDLCMDIAIQSGAALAMMPCCYRPPRNNLGLHDAKAHPDSKRRGFRDKKRAAPLGAGLFGGGGGDGDFKVLMSANDFKSAHADSFSFLSGTAADGPATGNRRKNKAIRKNKMKLAAEGRRGSTVDGASGSGSGGGSAGGSAGESKGGSKPKETQKGAPKRKTSVYHPLVPLPVEEHLGRGLSIDVFRTYRLQVAGYQVEWAAIPWEITHKNRFIVAFGCEREGDAKQEETAAAEVEGGTGTATGPAGASVAKGSAAAAATEAPGAGMVFALGIAVGIAAGVVLARQLK